MTKTWQETLQGLNFNLDDLVDGKMKCAENNDVRFFTTLGCFNLSMTELEIIVLYIRSQLHLSSLRILSACASTELLS